MIRVLVAVPRPINRAAYGGLLHCPTSGGHSGGTRAGQGRAGPVSVAPCLCLRLAIGSHGDTVGGFLCLARTEDLTIADTAALAIVPALLESLKPLQAK